jgi:hypothetical protein
MVLLKKLIFLISISILICACYRLPATEKVTPTGPQRTETRTPLLTEVILTYAPDAIREPATPTPLPSSPPPPTITPTNPATPTPLFTVDISGYNADLFPPIDVSHNPPLIARVDELASLVFSFANTFCMKLPVSCIPQGVLYYAYGEAGEFLSMPLTDEVVNEMESLVAKLSTANSQGEPLRYYAEFSVPEAGYTQRYPIAGTINLFAADEFIPVVLPVENPVKPGEKVYNFYWGYGIDKVRQVTYEGYPQRVGPPALDVSDNGILALMDPVNERIITFDLKESTYINYLMPFTYQFNADLAFDPRGRFMVCDYQGQENQATLGPDPVCYLLRSGGELEGVTPIYVISPGKINRELKILDYNDYRPVPIFNAQGQPNSQEVQVDKETWDLPYLYVEYPYLARYADAEQGLAFEVRSATPLGTLTEFERTPQGYLLVFNLGDRIRAVWIDPEGAILKDITLPYSQYTEINFNGQSAVAVDGALYSMSSTERGIEIHYVSAP